jgi:hypothetical protein
MKSTCITVCPGSECALSAQNMPGCRMSYKPMSLLCSTSALKLHSVAALNTEHPTVSIEALQAAAGTKTLGLNPGRTMGGIAASFMATSMSTKSGRGLMRYQSCAVAQQHGHGQGQAGTIPCRQSTLDRFQWDSVQGQEAESCAWTSNDNAAIVCRFSMRV